MDHIADLLAAHDGVLLRRELPRASSLRTHAYRTGTLATVLPGVYLAKGDAHNAQLLALAAMRSRPNAVLCEETAAQFTFWPELTSATVKAAGVQLRAAAPSFTFSRRVIPRDYIRTFGELRVTSPELTAVDLACRTDGESIDRLLRSRMGTIRGLAAALEATSGRIGNVQRRRLLIDSRDEPWSAAERLAHRILRAAGIHGWVANYRLRCRGRTYYLDIAFPGLKLVIEIDGRIHEWDPLVFENDRERQNDLVLEGWRVLRFTWRMLNDDPAGVIREIRRAVARTD